MYILSAVETEKTYKFVHLACTVTSTECGVSETNRKVSNTYQDRLKNKGKRDEHLSESLVT